MRASLLLSSAIAVLASLGGSCGGRTRATTVATAATTTAAAATTTAASEDTALPAAPVAHGTRKLMSLDAPVFVDGVEVAVLRYGDLPSLPHHETLAGGTPVFRLADYLAAVGVDLARLRAVHLHGNGDRIGSVEGRELRAEPARFRFSFASGTTGAAVQRWDTEGLANGFVVHELRKVSVFLEKPPTAIHPRSRCHLDASGACTKAVPYATADAAKGTRVVLDGRMVGFVKRRQLGDGLVLARGAGDDETTFSVARLARGFGVPDRAVVAVELVAGDEVVARATAEQWARLAPTLAFGLPRHHHGKIRVRLPAELQVDPETARERDALVSAILFHRRAPAALRELVPVSDDTDTAVRLGANDADPTGAPR